MRILEKNTPRKVIPIENTSFGEIKFVNNYAYSCHPYQIIIN